MNVRVTGHLEGDETVYFCTFPFPENESDCHVKATLHAQQQIAILAGLPNEYAAVEITDVEWV